MNDFDHKSVVKTRTSFGTKIILIVFCSLILSQLLGTFLSVLSFEKIFIAALTSKYEIIGKDIKRRIEQSLTFGKKLEAFVGMDRLVEPLFDKSSDLNEVFLATDDGKILFTSQKAQIIAVKGVSDEADSKGRILAGDVQTRESIPEPVLKDRHRGTSYTTFYNGRYYIMLPIEPKYGNKGLLGLVFDKSVIDQQKQEMLNSSIRILLLSVIATAIITGILVKILFLNPVRRQINAVLEQDIAQKKVEDPLAFYVPDEARQLIIDMAEFINDTKRIESGLKETLQQVKTQTGDDNAFVPEFRLIEEIMEGDGK